MTGTTSRIRLIFAANLETEATLYLELYFSSGSCYLPACSLLSSEFASLLKKRPAPQLLATDVVHGHIFLMILVGWMVIVVLPGVTA